MPVKKTTTIKTTGKTVKATKKKESKVIALPLDPEMKNWLVFQEGTTLFVFHFCGVDEKSQWFRKTDDWTTEKPKCEVCKLTVPDRLSAIVKLHMSGL